MSSLGLSLLILALIGVGAVVLYNYWLGGTFRRRLPESREPEPLLRQEPRFGRIGPGAAPEPAPQFDPVPGEEPGIDALDGEPPVLAVEDAVPVSAEAEGSRVADRQSGSEGTANLQGSGGAARQHGSEGAVISAQDRILEAQAARGGPPPARLDALADCCVMVDLAAPVAAERVMGLVRRFRRAGSKPVIVEGSLRPLALMAGSTAAGGADQDDRGDGAAASSPPVDGNDHADDASQAGAGLEVGTVAAAAPGPAAAAAALEDAWEALAPGRHYRCLRVGILMANRHGPLNAMEYSEFVAGLQSLADSLGAFVDPPDMMPVLERARELDARCAALDAQIGVNVEVAEALSPADLNGIAQSADVIERGNNRYARLGDQGEVVFSVALGDTPNRLTFLLDVPRVAAEREPLREMVACAWHCAQGLQGRMVDDTGRALTDAVFTRIEAQLAARYGALEGAGFRAGSPVALRLFN